MTAVHGGDDNIATESTKLFLVKDFVFGVEAKDHAYIFACFAKLASKHVHRWNTYATSYEQWCIACLGKVIAVAQDGEYIDLGADGQMAHSFGAYAYYLIYNGKYAISDIAYRYRATEELPCDADIYELARENARSVASKLHAIDILGYLFVGLYFKCKLLHFFFVLCLSIGEVPMRFRSASDEIPMEIGGR